MTSPSQGLRTIGLRYPSHDTGGCAAESTAGREASQPAALSSRVKQAYGVEASALDTTSPDNIGEAHFTGQGFTPLAEFSP